MGLDLKRILILLADTNRDGTVNLSDLPGVIGRVKSVQEDIDAVKDALSDLAETKKLTSNGEHVTPEWLKNEFTAARAEAKGLGDESRASHAAIKAATGIGGTP